MSELVVNGWKITHDGTTWWANREGDEPYAATAYFEAARWASANPIRCSLCLDRPWELTNGLVDDSSPTACPRCGKSNS